MNINTAKFPNEELLNSFLSDVQRMLLNQKNINEFEYPKELRNSKKNTWEKHVSEIRRRNESKLKEISAKSGVYALFTKSLDKNKWQLKYIGQTWSKHSRSRITNHLITKHKDTGAKLEVVKRSVQNGEYIGIVFIEVKPSELRHFLEERLISIHKPEWNQRKRKTL